MKYIFLVSLILLIASSPASSQVSSKSSGQRDSIEQELIQLEHEKDKAFERGDKVELARIYADDYMAIAANGVNISKREILEFFPRPNVFQSHRSADIVVRVFGDAAIVTGLQKRKFYKDIKSGAEDTLRYTNIYVKRDGEWRIVAAQFSPIKK